MSKIFALKSHNLQRDSGVRHHHHPKSAENRRKSQFQRNKRFVKFMNGGIIIKTE